MSSKRNCVIGVILIVSILSSVITGPFVFGSATPPQHDDTWYKVVNGVLDTDYYDLYPYEEKALKIGFSRYGELIGSPPSVPPDQVAPPAADWVGLEYDGVDPFANPSPLIGMTQWLNGWYIDIEYTDPCFSGAERDKHVWAFALFADAAQWGYNWTTVAEPTDAPHAGRKTNGIAETEPMKILYHGHTHLAAVLTTHIYDEHSVPVVDVIVTLVFDKVKKQVYMLKDIKLRIPKMHMDGRMDVQFSQREEWNLGVTAPFTSYAHMYHQEMNCCYTKEGHTADYLLRNWIDTIVYDSTTPGQGLNDIVWMSRKVFSACEKVYVDKHDDIPDAGWIFQKRRIDYDLDYTNSWITFRPGHIPNDNDVIKIEYKYHYKGEDIPGTGTGINWTAPENTRFAGGTRPTWFKGDWDYIYDVAQVIDRTWSYVGWHAYWPTLSDYTVDGRLQWSTFLTDTQRNDAIGVEPWFPPFLIGEWDFLLDHTQIPAFRCVSVIGLTDQHDADDASAGGAHTNVIDCEVRYQLDQFFLDTSETIYVDDDNTAGPWYGTVEHPYQNITSGLEHASAGDTLYVCNGTYYENVVVNKTVSLVGESKETTIIDGSGVGTVVLVDNVDDVRVSGFTMTNSGVTGFDSGIYVFGGIPNGCVISNNKVIDNRHGIVCSGTQNSVIIGNQIINAEQEGIWLLAGTNNTVTENDIENSGDYGIWIGSSSRNCIIENNVLYSYAAGIIIVYSANDNVVKGNNVSYSSLQEGIRIAKSDDNVISQNIIRNNGGHGINIKMDANNTQVHGNNIIGNGGYGIFIESGIFGSVIYHNNFINNSAHADGSINTWDDGYPSGGNFWSDYNGTDLYSGPYQDLSGCDGIGDTPYVIDEDNRDNYPLMNPWPDVTPPDITILSPQNITYTTTSVPLTFIIDECCSWIGYSLDKQVNVTIAGNITLAGLTEGSHSIVVYANDSHGNIGSSETVYFTIFEIRHTMVFFNIDPNPASPGQTITLRGVLIDQYTSPLGEETVELYVRPIGRSWRYIASVTTNSYGIFIWQATIPAHATGTFIFAVYYPGSESYESSYNFAILVIQ